MVLGITFYAGYEGRDEGIDCVKGHPSFPLSI